ncbi:MAG: sarcosine oxidase subunit alpha [Rhizobiaceae bacterium]|nr:sarcosine oxidase subunit alpha [Rhizobiaceae bacterium]
MFKTVLEAPDMIVTVNGVETPAWNGETVAGILMRVPDAGRTTAISGARRLPYCQMGVCFECLAIIDGVASSQGCLVPARPGMRIESQRGPREIAQ